MPHKDPEERRQAGKVRAARWRARHPEAVRVISERTRPQREAWAESHREQRRDSNRKYLYGITKVEFALLLQRQGNKCANPRCGAKEPGGNGTWHVDHDHRTGEVRGLLCRRCNVMIGYAKDDVQILEGGIEYLKNPPARTILRKEEEHECA